MARRSSRLISVALLAVGAVAGGAAPSVAADGGTPQIGARVRVQVSGLWPGWHMGVFNRLRVEPPCYRVLVFGPTHHVERMLSIREIERIQVSSLFDGHTRAEPTDPDEWTYAGETWRDLSIVTLRESEQRCPVQDR